MRRSGTAAYASGQATAARILEAAKQVVIEGGFGKLTMRGLARRLNMSPGNLSYYYASIDHLVADLFSHVLDPYLEELERLRAARPDDPEAQLEAVIRYIFRDLSRKETTCFFPEAWVRALRDAHAAVEMERIYARYRRELREIIAAIRPDLGPRSVADLALCISASIEGHTVFSGHGRPHEARARALERLVVAQSLALVRSAS